MKLLHGKDNSDVLKGRGGKNKEMPNHMKIGLFLGIKSCSNGIAKTSSKHQSPEKRARLANNWWDNKDNQPAHHKIKSETKFFIDPFGKNFVENTKNCRSPLD